MIKIFPPGRFLIFAFLLTLLNIEQSKKANIRNRYINDHTWPRTPHGKVTKTLTKTSHTRDSIFPAGDHKVAMNRQKTLETRNISIKKDPQKKHRHGTVSKRYFTGGFILVLWYQPHPYFRYGSRRKNIWFAWKIHNLSMYYLILNTSQDIKRR